MRNRSVSQFIVELEVPASSHHYHPYSPLTKLFLRGMVTATGLAGASPGITSQSRSHVARMEAGAGVESFYTIPYSAIKEIDNIRQYFATFAQVTFEDQSVEPLVLNAYMPDTDFLMRSRNTDFVRLAKKSWVIAKG